MVNLAPWCFAGGVFLTDLAVAGPGDGLGELVANPELHELVGDQHVAARAGVVLADADLLVVDADDTVAGAPPRHPLLAGALRCTLLRHPSGPGRGGEPACWGLVTDRAVLAFAVVLLHPLVQRLLRDF